MEKIEFPEYLVGYKAAIQEAKDALDMQDSSLEAAKDTARQILSAASLIVALVGILPVVGIGPMTRSVQYWMLIGIVAGLYVLLIGLCMYSLSLSRYYGPVLIEWNELYQGFVRKSDELEIEKTRLASYLNAFELHKPVIRRKVRAVNLTMWLLPVIVILLFISSIVP